MSYIVACVISAVFSQVPPKGNQERAGEENAARGGIERQRNDRGVSNLLCFYSFLSKFPRNGLMVAFRFAMLCNVNRV